MNRDRVERALREPGPREGGSGFVALPADIAEARAMLRRSDRNRILHGFLGAGAAVATAAVAVVVALALTQPPGPATNGVGSTSSSPSPTATPTPLPSELAGLPICQPDNLQAVADPWGAAAGSRGTTVTLTNLGNAACSLHGNPGAQIAEDGTTLVEARNPTGGVAPWSNPGDPVIRLDPGKKAATTVRWSNWCGAQPSSTMSLSLRLVTGMLSVKPGPTSGDVPPCNGTDPSSLSTITFFAP